MVKVKRLRTIDCVVMGYRPGVDAADRRLADPRPLRARRRRCARSGTARRSRPSASASCRRELAPSRRARAAAASRAAGAPTASSSGSRCVRSSSSRSATTTSATGASATAPRSSAGAMTSRRASARSTSCAEESAAPGARGLHPRALARSLREVRRPRRVGEPLGLVALGQLEQTVERAGVIVDRGGRVAALLQARRHCVETQRRGIDVVELSPLERVDTRASGTARTE